MKNKGNMKLFVGIIVGALISAVGVYAAVTASSITYSNTTSGLKDANGNNVTNVQGAIDAIYGKLVDKLTLGATTQSIANSATRSTENSASISLDSGKYVCNATYSGGSASSTGSSYYAQTSGYFEITNCDNYSSVNEYKNFMTAQGTHPSLTSGNWLAAQLVQLTFTCDLNSSKTVTATVKGYSEADYLPYIISVNCTKIN